MLRYGEVPAVLEEPEDEEPVVVVLRARGGIRVLEVEGIVLS